MSTSLAGPHRAADHATGCREGETPPSGDDQYRLTVLEQQIEGLTRALCNRDAIGQAKGILIVHYDIGADDAFRLLIRVSQHTNIKLAEIARIFVTLVRERGPAQQCRVVTEVLEAMLDQA